MTKKSITRTSALRVRLTVDEHRTISAAAEEVGVGICTFARMAALRAAGLPDVRQRRRKANESQKLIARYLGELAAIGNNVNQLARAWHSGWDCDPAILKIAAAELRALREVILARNDDHTK